MSRRDETAALVVLLREAGLTGRGGAAFPTAVKLEAALEHRSRLVVNVCDGEVGAAKDAFVVEQHLDELVHGAGLLGRRHVVYAAHRDSWVERLLREAGLPVLSVPDRYVSSEESSLVSLAHGGLARPVTKHRPVVHGGTDGSGKRLRPTLVVNAETVWRVSQIERHGAAWFRSWGTPDEPGPRLVTVGGAVAAPGVVETESGVSVRDLLDAAGGVVSPPGGITVGGLSGGWLSPSEAEGAVWSSAWLGRYGLRLGTGVLGVLGAGRCPLVHAGWLVDWAAGESAGQCGPCMFGLPAVADDLLALADGRLGRSGLQRLHERVGLLPGRGACRFPDGVAGFVASTLRAFPLEVSTHVVGGCSVSPRPAEAVGR